MNLIRLIEVKNIKFFVYMRKDIDSDFMKYHKSTSFESWLVVILFLSGFLLLIGIGLFFYQS